MENLTHRLASLSDKRAQYQLNLLLSPLFERLRTQTQSSAGLVIKGASSALVKTGAAVTHVVAQGIKLRIAAATDMAALSGTVTNAAFNVFVFTVDSAGTLATQMGTEGASEAAIKWPSIDSTKAIVGYIVVNPTGTGDFVGGTTPLDDVTVVPNVVYINTLGAFWPNIDITEL
jgi:hypothetical protein